jgi:signal recognition particle receptor subunit beta
MAVFNYAKKEIDAKIVYYGPAISGKTTNLQFIHGHLKPDQRGKMVSLATNEDRTLFFDFLPIELDSVRGFKTRFHLYTVPGQVYYGATRRAVLTGADGVVFVADSHADRMEDNVASLRDLEDNLRYYGKKIDTVPLVVQYNKRDLPNVLSVEELNQKLNRLNSPHFEGVAVLGKGVFETLTMTCRLVLKAIENGVESRRTVSGTGKTSPPAAPPGPKGLRLEKAAGPAETLPPRLETMAGKGSPLGKEAAPPRPFAPGLETPRTRALRPERTPLPPEVPAAAKVPPSASSGKIPSLTQEKPDKREEGKRVLESPFPAEKAPEKTPEKKRPDLSFNLDRGKGMGAAKKPFAAKEGLRILSCGQPRVSSPGSVEIPLTLEVDGSENSRPLNINLSIKLESIEPEID